jgi:stage II sporulation protein D
MSQWGAKALAEQGADYRAILAHYYPGTQLTRMDKTGFSGS